MDLDDCIDVTTIPAAHARRDRNPAAPIDDRSVALAESLDGKRQAPQSIATERIRAREVEHEVGSMPFEHDLERLAQTHEILIVTGPVGEGDVQIARLLAERKILLAMQLAGEDRRIVAKDRRRAVALVHIAIDDGDPQRTAA
jgi:hypothetical protein